MTTWHSTHTASDQHCMEDPLQDTIVASMFNTGKMHCMHRAHRTAADIVWSRLSLFTLLLFWQDTAVCWSRGGFFSRTVTLFSTLWSAPSIKAQMSIIQTNFALYGPYMTLKILKIKCRISSFCRVELVLQILQFVFSLWFHHYLAFFCNITPWIVMSKRGGGAVSLTKTLWKLKSGANFLPVPDSFI